MKGKGILFWALFMLIMGGGCAEFRSVEREELPAEQTALIAEHADLYREVAEASPFIRSVDGYADIWIKTPKQQHRVFSNIRISRGHETRMIVSAGLLGWPVADIFFGRDSLYVHNIVNNRLFIGSNNDQNLEKILGVNSGYRLLSEALLGLVNITEPAGAIRSVRKGSGKLLFTLESQNGSKEVVIDPSNRTLSTLLIKDRQGKTATEMHFSDFESCSIEGRRVLVPKKIEMVLYNSVAEGSGEHQLVIVYDERVFNPLNLSLRFSLPKNARVVNLDEAAMLPWM